MFFWIYGLGKTVLDNFLKSLVSKDRSTSNMVNGPKHCWNLNESTFTMLIDPCEGNSGWKNFSEWYAKSSDCWLILWLPMRSIPFLTQAGCCNIFRWKYLRNEKYFLVFFFVFFLHSLNLDSFLNIFKKNMTLIAMYFWTYRLPKMFLDKCLKTSVSEDPSTSDIINGLKHCWRLSDSTFTIFIDGCEAN